MIFTSFRTISFDRSLESPRLLMDLHASARPLSLSVTARTSPNCPRPSSAPNSYASFTSTLDAASPRIVVFVFAFVFADSLRVASPKPKRPARGARRRRVARAARRRARNAIDRARREPHRARREVRRAIDD
jgi:hypothetical protein